MTDRGKWKDAKDIDPKRVLNGFIIRQPRETMAAEITKHGFKWGPAEVSRYFNDEKKGWVVIGVITAKYPSSVQVYVTKTGKVRVTAKGEEWTPPDRRPFFRPGCDR